MSDKTIKEEKNTDDTSKDELEIKYYKIADLIHPDYNPRFISESDFEQLKKSLQAFKAVEPAVINKATERDNIIVGGNQRIRAAEALGWETFPCVEVVLTLQQERELNIRLNKNNGNWNYDELSNFFEFDELTAWGFKEAELTGLDFDDVKDDTGEPKEKEVKTVKCPKCGHEWEER